MLSNEILTFLCQIIIGWCYIHDKRALMNGYNLKYIWIFYYIDTLALIIDENFFL